jgi:hypothetical protein
MYRVLINRGKAAQSDEKCGHCGEHGHGHGNFEDKAHVGVAMPESAQGEKKKNEQNCQKTKTDYSGDQTDDRGTTHVTH